MKKHIILLVLILAIIITPLVLTAAQRVTKVTSQTEWLLLRATACEDPNTIIGSADVTTTIATAGDYASKPTAANGIVVLNAEHDSDIVPGSVADYSTDAYAVEIVACANDNNKTFTVVLYTWEKNNGPATKLCSIAYTTGTKQVVKYLADDSDNSITSGDAATDIAWADTAVVTSSWYDNMILTADAAGGNGMARVLVILSGQAYIYAQVSGADGVTGVEASSVTLYYRKISG